MPLPRVGFKHDNEEDCIRSAQSAGRQRRLTHSDLVRWEPEHFGYNSLN